jgi:hypothetical protein
MKRGFLIISAAILLSVSGNCQWYNRRYGVSDINQLSLEQLNEALIRAQNGVKGGIVISSIGALGLGVGGYFILHKTMTSEGFQNQNIIFTGIKIVILSIPIEIAGLTILSINNYRKTSIKEVLNSTGLKLGLVNYQQGNIFSTTQGSLLPCLSVTIHF